MKKACVFILVVSLVMFAISQNLSLKFTGAIVVDSSYVRLDSVTVQNINRSWSETLVYPDTVLSFTQTGIVEAQGTSAVITSYPNPFTGTTNVAVFMPQSGETTLQVYNLAGQKVAERSMALSAGNNLFEIRLQNPQMYLLAVTTQHGRGTIKMLNRGQSSENAILHNGTTAFEKRQCANSFQSGDVLKIIGYATLNGVVVGSRVVQQQQTTSENFRLIFPVAPAVSTTAASGITTTTATTGGTVSSDGGAAVTARGVCWNTSQNPTVSGNHTTDSSGTGSFTSNLTGLMPGITYYVRAYATNAAGTVYGSQVTFTTFAESSGSFSVSDSDIVVFSPGNLQWSATGGGSTPTTHVTADSTAEGTWRFAPNQWDIIGANNSNASSTYSGWIDLFGWGTSGWDNTSDDNLAVHYQPWDTSNTYNLSSTTNRFGYGPSTNMPNPDIAGSNHDWGVYNAIYNPRTTNTDSPGIWRTLTPAEWDYLINTRITTSGIRYAFATVSGVRGLILVPDGWSASSYALDSTNSPTAPYTANVVTSAQWATLDNAGAIFLPAAGHRSGASTCCFSGGYYWTATYGEININRFGISAQILMFFDLDNVYTISSYCGRCNGCSVRLVKDVQ